MISLKSSPFTFFRLRQMTGFCPYDSIHFSSLAIFRGLICFSHNYPSFYVLYVPPANKIQFLFGLLRSKNPFSSTSGYKKVFNISKFRLLPHLRGLVIKMESELNYRIALIKRLLSTNTSASVMRRSKFSYETLKFKLSITILKGLVFSIKLSF